MKTAERLGHLLLVVAVAFVVTPSGRSTDPGIVLDAEGLPLVHYDGDVGVQRSPGTVAQFGLDAFDDGREALGLAAADWMVDNQGPRGEWAYDFQYQRFRLGVLDLTLEPGWVSAMDSGLAMSLFARAHDATGDRRYVDAAKRAVDFLSVPMSEGGTATTLDGHVWWDEYPDEEGASFVLNGFMFTLVGLWDIAPMVPEAPGLYEQGRATLDAVLHRFDADGRAAYDLRFYPWVNPLYDDVHHTLLKELDRQMPTRPVAEAIRGWYLGPDV